MSDDMTEQEREEWERIHRIEDFWEWHKANSDFWTRYFHNNP